MSQSASLPRGRYWIRTSGPFLVGEVRYRCAKRPLILSYVKVITAPNHQATAARSTAQAVS